MPDWPAYLDVMRDPRDLILGCHFDHVDYDWRPYPERPEDHREDYDRLKVDLAERGMKNPLITWNDHVLIGMRRCEIAVDLGWSLVRCWEIQDDLNADWTPDRVFALRDRYRKASY